MTYIGYTIGDGDRGQACAFIESIITNSGYTVGDGDRGQACAFIVFASRLLSAFCALNGRKVTTQIL